MYNFFKFFHQTYIVQIFFPNNFQAVNGLPNLIFFIFTYLRIVSGAVIIFSSPLERFPEHSKACPKIQQIIVFSSFLGALETGDLVPSVYLYFLWFIYLSRAKTYLRTLFFSVLVLHLVQKTAKVTSFSEKAPKPTKMHKSQ